MDVLEMEALLKNVDQRLQRVEQILPTLATHEELREEGERTRRHFDIVAERLRDDIRLIAEGQVHLGERFEDLRHELKTDIAALDARLMRLEAAGKPHRRRSREP